MNISEIEVLYTSTNTNKIKINNSKDTYEVIMSNWNMSTIELFEEVKLVLLNRANQVLGINLLSKGGTSEASIDCKLLFSVALKCNASGIIIVHNHPSGNLEPSRSDILLTKKINQASKLLDLNLLDHLIVSKSSYTSLADKGFL